MNLLSVHVLGFAEHRSNSAEKTLISEEKSLKNAFDLICASAKSKNINKDIWMSILLATGKTYGKSYEDYRISSILIFELMDKDANSTLEQDEFVKACMKGLLGKVRKKHINVSNQDMNSASKRRQFGSRIPDCAWSILTQMFDTVGGNFIWCFWACGQAIFSIIFWNSLAERTKESLHATQDVLSEEIFDIGAEKLVICALEEGIDYYGNDKTCPIVWPPTDNTNHCTFMENHFRHEFENKFDAKGDEISALIDFDNVFIILTLIECVLRCSVYVKRSLDYPTFSKRAIPRMESIDLGICSVLMMVMLLDTILYSSNYKEGSMYRTLLALRGLRLIHVFPAITRFRSTDHNLLAKQEISGRKITDRSEWFHDLFDFNVRLEMNYDASKRVTKSTKGPLMRIGNTFVRCFEFAIRQLFLISIFIYGFTCIGQMLLFWVPCTMYGERPKSVPLHMIYPEYWKCQENAIEVRRSES